MSLTMIKKCLKKLKDQESSLAWVEEEVSDLLYAIADHLLALGKEHEVCGSDPEALGMMTISDFCKQEKIFSAGMIHGYRERHPDFASECTVMSNNKVYVHPNKTREYLKSMPRFKKLLERFGRT